MDDQKLPLLEDDNSYDEEPSTRVERRILFCAVNKASKYVFNCKWDRTSMLIQSSLYFCSLSHGSRMREVFVVGFLKEIWLKKDTVIIVYCPKLPKKVNSRLLVQQIFVYI